jgi:dTDP-4-dehydrorhamnose reductase
MAERRTIFVAGATGQVAHALVEAAQRRGVELVAHGRPGFDLERPEGLGAAVVEARPAAIVNAAAYTAVDKAESEPARAFAINRDGAAALARAAAVLDVPFIHLSTDYVFEGSKPTPYVEDDPTGPTSVYGQSKLAGEAAVVAAHRKAIVLRTAWVYGPHGGNFVKTMLRLAGERDSLKVVDDQVGSPTAATDIAEAILSILAIVERSGWQEAFGGVHHLAGSGETTWCGFARAIMEEAAARGACAVPIAPIATAEYPTPARRPANSRLDATRLQQTFGIRLPPWRDSLAETLDRLVGPRR